MSLSTSREIAHGAIRERLRQVTLEQVVEHGFEAVTLHDLAAAAGVSRSTLLRYVGSKAEAVVSGLMAIGDDIAAALRARPLSEDRWTALRRSLDAVVETHGTNRMRDIALIREIWTNPALSSALWQQRTEWRSSLADAMRSREPQLSGIEAATLAAGALGCLDTATEAWADSDGETDFAGLLDRSFDALRAALNGPSVAAIGV